MDLARLRRIVHDRCGLAADRPVLAGVSGGADSLALLYALHQLGFPLVAAHFDHQLRPDSGADALAVEQFAHQLGVICVLGGGDVRAQARASNLSLEAAARRLRYQFLFEQARQCGAQAVAVGHHADDQAETVLLHILRGSGLRGLAGMRWRSLLPEWDAAIPLVRPLLGVTRAEIDVYCQQHGLAPRSDSSNSDPQFLRNRIRLELLPLLEQYSPQVRDALVRLADVAAEETGIVDSVVEQAWQQCLETSMQGQANLRRADLLALAPPLRRAVLRRAANTLLPPGESVDFAAVQRANTFVETAQTGQVDLTSNVTLFLVGRLVCLTAGTLAPQLLLPQLPAEKQRLTLAVPAQVALQNGWQIAARYASLEELPPAGAIDRWQAWLDAETLDGALTIRAPQPGDRLQPFGMEGHTVKLSDWLTNHKIPRPARAAWPLVADSSAIVWVPGLRIAEPYRVSPQTQRIVHLRVWREPPAR